MKLQYLGFLPIAILLIWPWFKQTDDDGGLWYFLAFMVKWVTVGVAVILLFVSGIIWGLS